MLPISLVHVCIQTISTACRASSIFNVYVEQREPGRSNVGLRSTLSLIDLAGIESGACQNLINCIQALKEKKPAIPYRDSTVTRVLQVLKRYSHQIVNRLVTQFYLSHLYH